MCGIAGIVEHDASEPMIDLALLAHMGEAIRHRGPDDEGVWISENRRAGFAFRRLSIIDLSEAGRQPMTTPDGRYTLAFNGEVYNHRDLRKDLESKGYRYRGRSDSETILYGYQEYGEAFFERMNGMWGLAIWDDHTRELICVRDRIGIKPLYYAHQNGRFLFGSEIKAILRHPAISASMNLDELAYYLAFSMSSEASTLFTGIRKLRPGHILKLSADNIISIRRYWNPADAVRSSEQMDVPEIEAEILRLLRQSVKDRMMSDVPFGVFLSGGVDSSVNVALMAELMDRPVQTFTVGFKELEQYNELGYARQIAHKFATDHREILIDHRDAEQALETLIWHEDEPNGDPVCIPLNFVSKLARGSGTTVIQVGEGSDEQFLGYSWMHRERKFFNTYWKAYRLLPRLLRNPLYTVARPLFEWRRQFLALDYLRRASGDDELYWGGGLDLAPAHQRWLFARDRLSLTDIPATMPARFQAELRQTMPQADFAHSMLYFELAHRLPELLLMRVDKIGMAHSLEARVPFLDHRLVEFSMGIPESVKAPRGAPTKVLLKKAVESLLPRDIIYRKKQGFAAPIDEWLRGPLLPYFESKFFGSRLLGTGIFDEQRLRTFFEAHRSGAIRAGKSLYALLNLALWYDRFID